VAADLFEAGIALCEAALAEDRAYRAGVEVRLAKLRAAQSLAEAGRQGESDRMLRDVEREQRRLGFTKGEA
jgi:hypothetical protein